MPKCFSQAIQLWVWLPMDSLEDSCLRRVKQKNVCAIRSAKSFRCPNVQADPDLDSDSLLHVKVD